MTFPTATEADIALLLEGTFPYVSGGVSSWVNQIIRAYPEYRFAIVFLGSRREDYSQQKYELPTNVVHFEEHFLYDNLHNPQKPSARAGDREAFAISADMHEKFLRGGSTAEAKQAFKEVARAMLPGRPLVRRLLLDRAHHVPAAVDCWPAWPAADPGARCTAPPPATRAFSAACCSRRAARR
jgi:hypothetical protein